MMKPGDNIKLCTGGCRRTLPIEQFPITSRHGVEYRRSWCRECLLVYYVRRYRIKKFRRLTRKYDSNTITCDAFVPPVGPKV